MSKNHQVDTIHGNAELICQKKRHSKSIEDMGLKRNQTKLHIEGLILIDFQVNWMKTVAVSFFLDKFLNLFTFSTRNKKKWEK